MIFDKKTYWKNRGEGKRGQGEETKSSPSATEIPLGAKISFTNEGSMVINNRSYRRKKYSLFKKSSQLRKRKPRKRK